MPYKPNKRPKQALTKNFPNANSANRKMEFRQRLPTAEEAEARKPRVFSKATGTPGKGTEITNLSPDDKIVIQKKNAVQGALADPNRSANEKENIKERNPQEAAALDAPSAEAQALANQVGQAPELSQDGLSAAPSSVDEQGNPIFDASLKPQQAGASVNNPAQDQLLANALGLAGGTLVGGAVGGGVLAGVLGAAPAAATAGATATANTGIVKGALAFIGVSSIPSAGVTFSRQKVKELKTSISSSQSNMNNAINAINAGGYGHPPEYWLDIYQQEISNINRAEQALKLSSRGLLNFASGASDELEKIERWRSGGQLETLNGRMRTALLQPDPTKIMVEQQVVANE